MRGECRSREQAGSKEKINRAPVREPMIRGVLRRSAAAAAIVRAAAVVIAAAAVLGIAVQQRQKQQQPEGVIGAAVAVCAAAAQQLPQKEQPEQIIISAGTKHNMNSPFFYVVQYILRIKGRRCYALLFICAFL